uniref:Osteocrin n=1 Tax=Amphiprion percula TaxID=161767 RepID=A0A3P8TR35_AMPPE
MSSCSCLLFCFLLSFIAVLHGSDQVTRTHLAVAMATLKPNSQRPRPRGVKVGEELTVKLLRLDDLVRMENDVMEPKRKRSFPGNNAPLDRLSVSSMETKQTTNKQSKVVELPRRRSNPPPIDRIGMSRLPNSRG